MAADGQCSLPASWRPVTLTHVEYPAGKRRPGRRGRLPRAGPRRRVRSAPREAARRELGGVGVAGTRVGTVKARAAEGLGRRACRASAEETARRRATSGAAGPPPCACAAGVDSRGARGAGGARVGSSAWPGLGPAVPALPGCWECLLPSKGSLWRVLLWPGVCHFRPRLRVGAQGALQGAAGRHASRAPAQCHPSFSQAPPTTRGCQVEWGSRARTCL